MVGKALSRTERNRMILAKILPLCLLLALGLVFGLHCATQSEAETFVLAERSDNCPVLISNHHRAGSFGCRINTLETDLDIWRKEHPRAIIVEVHLDAYESGSCQYMRILYQDASCYCEGKEEPGVYIGNE